MHSYTRRPKTSSQETCAEAAVPGTCTGKNKNKSKFATNKQLGQQLEIEQETEGKTRIPGQLRAGLESLSGVDLSGVRVHSNSTKPAEVNAYAFTQGQDIFLGPHQEKYLPHEGWHAVQQIQGRVKPTIQAKGSLINNDERLEHEADTMGARALRIQDKQTPQQIAPQHRGLLLGPKVSKYRCPNEVGVLQKQSEFPGFSQEEIDEFGVVTNHTRTGEDTGSAAQSAVGETHGRKIGKAGRISREQFLRKSPIPTKGENVLKTLSFNTWVFVEKRGGFKGGWYKVVTNQGDIGWVPAAAAALDLPEPNAELYQVRPRDKAINLVAKWYKPKDGFGRAWNPFNDDPGDAQFYVAALALANKDRAGVDSPGDLNATDGWKRVKVIYPNTIWKPSKGFLDSLAGKISSGSTVREVWDTAVSVAEAVGNFIVGGGAFIGGLVYGALESVYDLFAGAVELVVMVWDILVSFFKGNIISDAKSLWNDLKKVDLNAISESLKKKWSADSILDRWFFRGRVLGYIIMEIVMMIFSGGALTAIKWAGKFGKIGKLLSKLPKVAELTSKMGKAVKSIKLPEKASQLIKFKKIGKGAKIKKGIEVGKESVELYLRSAEHINKRADAWLKYTDRGGKKSKKTWENMYNNITRNRLVGNLAEEQFAKFMKGTPQNYKVKVGGKEVLRKVDNVLGTTAREIKSGPLKLTPFIKKQILKDIQLMKVRKMKVEWHLLAGGDAKAIAALKKGGFDVIVY